MKKKQKTREKNENSKHGLPRLKEFNKNIEQRKEWGDIKGLNSSPFISGCPELSLDVVNKELETWKYQSKAVLSGDRLWGKQGRLVHFICNPSAFKQCFHLLLSLLIRFVKTAFSSYQYVMFLFHFLLGQCHKLCNLCFDGGEDAVKGTEDRVDFGLVLWIASYICSQTNISFLLTSIFKIYAQLYSLDID